jgi:two-component system nitrate/nitrite response regulator NarL
VRLVLCDGHRLFAESMAGALEARGHLVVVTTSPAGAVHAVDEHEPDLCLMDLRFPGTSGLDAVSAIRAQHPFCDVVVFTGSAAADDIAAAGAAGATGFIAKDQPVAAVFDAIRRIARGQQLPPPPSLQADAAPTEGRRVRGLIDSLTRREREVLHLLLDAEDTAHIARSLGVAPSTARSHLQSVLEKLGVHSRLQAVALVADLAVDGVAGRPSAGRAG